MRSLRMFLAALVVAAGLSAVSFVPTSAAAGSGVAATAAQSSPTIVFMALGAGFLLTAAVLLFAGSNEPAHTPTCRCRACRPRR